SPLLAKFMVQRLYLPVFLSVILSLMILSGLSGFAFLFIKGRMELKLQEKENQGQISAGADEASHAENGSPESEISEISRHTVEDSGLEEAVPSLKEVASALEEEPAPGLEEVVSGPEEAAPNLEEAAPGPEEVVSTLEEPVPSLEEVVPGLEEVASSSEESVPVAEQAALAAEKELSEEKAPVLLNLLEEALACKNRHELQRATFLYEAALLQKPDAELLEWIVIDLCALYKMTNQQKLIHKTLESEYSNLLNLQIKEEILRNI
ncbi:MAG TPA: hypothetical protein DD738_08375, partial [Ruminiclostridium sp.]|nr:hypothetical protein [Ruminiclostridium sp.]